MWKQSGVAGRRSAIATLRVPCSICTRTEKPFSRPADVIPGAAETPTVCMDAMR